MVIACKKSLFDARLLLSRRAVCSVLCALDVWCVSWQIKLATINQVRRCMKDKEYMSVLGASRRPNSFRSGKQYNTNTNTNTSY